MFVTEGGEGEKNPDQVYECFCLAIMAKVVPSKVFHAGL